MNFSFCNSRFCIIQLRLHPLVHHYVVSSTYHVDICKCAWCIEVFFEGRPLSLRSTVERKALCVFAGTSER